LAFPVFPLHGINGLFGLILHTLCFFQFVLSLQQQRLQVPVQDICARDTVVDLFL
jgi:hypothetical protein